MSTVYLISSSPESEEVRKAFEKAYHWVSVDNIQALAAYQTQKGIVLLSAAMENLQTQAGLIRNYAPHLSVVIAVRRDNLEKLDQDTLQHADLLVLPTAPIEISARLNQAAQLSELRHTINANLQMDEVTGLYSYTSFLKRLAEEMSLSKRHQAPLVCVILSISFFEMYIDSYGYQFAAGLMEQVTAVIKTQVRSEDITARLGDGEIGFLLPHSTEKGALSLTRRVIDKVAAMPFQIHNQQEQIELRAGIAGFPMPDEPNIDADTLIRYTRHALHHAKCSEDTTIQMFGAMKPMVG